MESKAETQLATTEQKEKYKSFLILHNVGKKKNVGTIIRSACAFNLDKIFLISKNSGGKKYKPEKDFNFFGNQNTACQIDYHVFFDLKEAKEHFVQNNISVCGVEIMKDSQNITTHPFKGHTAFILGNEGTGMTEQQKAICDHFVYIPQYTNKTASLNIAVAGSIIFHHFALWAGFEQTPIYHEKFQIQGGGDSDEEEEAKKPPAFKFNMTINKPNQIETNKDNEGIDTVEGLGQMFD